ncbi:MAG: chorismate mutase [Bacteroidota bacterium]|nr:chorismate mutase [Bacteroidota bacterium]
MEIENFFYNKPFLIAGPCSAESKKQTLDTALKVANHIDVFRAGIWKPRTSPSSYNGPGEIGLKWLQEIKNRLQKPVMTEVANALHVEKCLKAGIDMLWIGARTTVNPFYVEEIAQALKGVNIPIFVKNPIHPELALWIGAFERLNKSGVTHLAAIHRGFFMYQGEVFRNDPKWEIPIKLKKEYPELPIICDPSHIAGKRRFIQEVSQTALDLNMDGLMIETHISPNKALSDSSQQISPSMLISVINKTNLKASKIEDKKGVSEIKKLRDKIDILDENIVKLLNSRQDIVRLIGKIKKETYTTIFQIERWNQILKNRNIEAKKLNLDKDMLREIFELIHKYAILSQTKEK